MLRHMVEEELRECNNLGEGVRLVLLILVPGTCDVGAETLDRLGKVEEGLLECVAVGNHHAAAESRGDSQPSEREACWRPAAGGTE